MNLKAQYFTIATTGYIIHTAPKTTILLSLNFSGKATCLQVHVKEPTISKTSKAGTAHTEPSIDDATGSYLALIAGF